MGAAVEDTHTRSFGGLTLLQLPTPLQQLVFSSHPGFPPVPSPLGMQAGAGAVVGGDVGLLEGAFDGLEVGLDVGGEDRLPLGLLDGAFEGLPVGLDVGDVESCRIDFKRTMCKKHEK